MIPVNLGIKDAYTSYEKFILKDKFDGYLETTIDFDREYSMAFFFDK